MVYFETAFSSARAWSIWSSHRRRAPRSAARPPHAHGPKRVARLHSRATRAPDRRGDMAHAGGLVVTRYWRERCSWRQQGHIQARDVAFCAKSNCYWNYVAYPRGGFLVWLCSAHSGKGQRAANAGGSCGSRAYAGASCDSRAYAGTSCGSRAYVGARFRSRTGLRNGLQADERCDCGRYGARWRGGDRACWQGRLPSGLWLAQA